MFTATVASRQRASMIATHPMANKLRERVQPLAMRRGKDRTGA
jgi:hypothetical protein